MRLARFSLWYMRARMAARFATVAVAAAAAGVSFVLLLVPQHRTASVTSVPAVSGVVQPAAVQPASVGRFVPCHHH
jgi:hypothetical protein